MSPKVSVIINTRNSMRFFRQAINSVWRQSLEDFEVIVWDHASNDGLADYIATLEDARLRFFVDHQSQSLQEVRRRAIEVSTGDYIAFLDADDYWEPSKLESQLTAFQQPSVVATCSSYWLHTQDSMQVASRSIFRSYRKRYLRRHEVIANYRVGFSTLMVDGVVARALMPQFCGSYRLIEDLVLVELILRDGILSSDWSPLTTYRIHEANASQDTEALLNERDHWLKAQKAGSKDKVIVKALGKFSDDTTSLRARQAYSRHRYRNTLHCILLIASPWIKIKTVAIMLLAAFGLHRARLDFSSEPEPQAGQ